MRAAIWEGPGLMAMGTVPDPTCPVDGVLLRVLACGICGTDVRSFYNGDRRIEPPWVLGHEISGEVLEIGEAAATEVALGGISVGDAVHCISTLWCGRCRMCLGGNEHLCLRGELMGFNYPGRTPSTWRSPRSRSRTSSGFPTASPPPTRRSPIRCRT